MSLAIVLLSKYKKFIKIIGLIHETSEGIMIKLSLCLLTKNNGSALRRCFYPIQEFLHEILAIDLGSSDNTQQVLTEADAKIIAFDVKNDFGAAKNKLIEAASGDFLLFLNPDEVIFKADIAQLMDYLEKNKSDNTLAYMFYVRNYTNKKSAGGFKPARSYGFEGYFTSEQVRLIKNDKRIKFTFNIDESLMPELDKLKAVIKHVTDVPVHNYCYRANLELLEQHAAAEPSNARVNYNTAIAHLNIGNLAKAKNFFTKVVEHAPSYKRALFNLGSLYMAEGKLETAAKMIQQSLEFDDKNAGAYFNLGLIMEKSKQLDKSELFLKKALLLEPNDFRVYKAMALLYHKMNNKELARKAMNSAIYLNPQDPELIALKNAIV